MNGSWTRLNRKKGHWNDQRTQWIGTWNPEPTGKANKLSRLKLSLSGIRKSRLLQSNKDRLSHGNATDHYFQRQQWRQPQWMSPETGEITGKRHRKPHCLQKLTINFPTKSRPCRQQPRGYHPSQPTVKTPKTTSMTAAKHWAIGGPHQLLWHTEILPRIGTETFEQPKPTSWLYGFGVEQNWKQKNFLFSFAGDFLITMNSSFREKVEVCFCYIAYLTHLII